MPFPTPIDFSNPETFFKALLSASEDERLDLIGSRYNLREWQTPTQRQGGWVIDIPAAQSALDALAYARNVPHDPGYRRTTLSPRDESQFESWAKANRIGDLLLNDLTPGYDMRAFWQEMLKGNVLPKLTKHGVTYPAQFNTPYSLDFGPRSQFYKP